MPKIQRSIFRQRLGVTLTDADIAQLPKTMMAVTKPWWFQFIARRVQKHAPVIATFNFSLVKAPQSENWATNDIGFVRFISSFDNPVQMVLDAREFVITEYREKYVEEIWLPLTR